MGVTAGAAYQEVGDAGTNTGDSQMGGWPRAESGYSRTDTGDAQVDGGPHAVAKSGTRVLGEAWDRHITISDRI